MRKNLKNRIQNKIINICNSCDGIQEGCEQIVAFLSTNYLIEGVTFLVVNKSFMRIEISNLSNIYLTSLKEAVANGYKIEEICDSTSIYEGMKFRNYYELCMCSQSYGYLLCEDTEKRGEIDKDILDMISFVFFSLVMKNESRINLSIDKNTGLYLIDEEVDNLINNGEGCLAVINVDNIPLELKHKYVCKIAEIIKDFSMRAYIGYGNFVVIFESDKVSVHSTLKTIFTLIKKINILLDVNIAYSEIKKNVRLLCENYLNLSNAKNEIYYVSAIVSQEKFIDDELLYAQEPVEKNEENGKYNVKDDLFNANDIDSCGFKSYF